MEIRPGLEIDTASGKCILLYPDRFGHPEGDWVGLLEDGKGIIVTRQEISDAIGATADGYRDKP